MNVIWNRSQKYYDSASWRGNKLMDGGLFLNQTSHYLDLLVYLFGLPTKVSSFLTKTRKNIQVEDTGIVNLLFPNFITGSFNTTMLNNFGNLETSMTLIGTKGSIVIGGLNLDKVNYYKTTNDDKFDFRLNKNEKIFFKKPYKGHEIYYKNMYYSLIGKKSETPTGKECLNTMKLIDKIYKSSKVIKTKY